MKTVLILEDDGHGHETLQGLLQKYGYKVTKESDHVLQVSELSQDTGVDVRQNDEKSPLAIFRSSLDGKVHAVTQASGKTLQVAKLRQDTEQQYRNIYENAPVGIFRTNLDGKLLSINPAGARMYKYASPQEMIAEVNRTSLAEALYVHADSRQELMDRVLHAEGWQVCEECFRCKDGSIIDCAFHLCAVRSTEGVAVELEGFVEDITKLKRAERSLGFAQFAIDKTMGQVLWINEQGHILYVNDSACDILGYSRLELASMSVYDIDPECTPEFVASQWQDLKRRGSKTYERLHRSRDGHVYPVESRANYLIFEGQESLCFFVSDISERKRQEQDLRLTQFAIDKSAGQAFWGTPEGRFLYVNEAACAALGYSREELVGMSISDIDPDFSAEKLVGHWQNLKKIGTIRSESRHRTKDGRIYPVEILANYVNFDGKEYRCSFATDISERKRAEEALQDSERRYRSIVEHPLRYYPFHPGRKTGQCQSGSGRHSQIRFGAGAAGNPQPFQHSGHVVSPAVTERAPGGEDSVRRVMACLQQPVALQGR